MVKLTERVSLFQGRSGRLEIAGVLDGEEEGTTMLEEEAQVPAPAVVLESKVLEAKKPVHKHVPPAILEEEPTQETSTVLSENTTYQKRRRG